MGFVYPSDHCAVVKKFVSDRFLLNQKPFSPSSSPPSSPPPSSPFSLIIQQMENTYQNDKCFLKWNQSIVYNMFWQIFMVNIAKTHILHTFSPLFIVWVALSTNENWFCNFFSALEEVSEAIESLRPFWLTLPCNMQQMILMTDKKTYE